MRERIELWLRRLDEWSRDPCPPNRVPDWLSGSLDRLHHIAWYLSRNPDVPDEVRRQHEAVCRQWLKWRESNREVCVNEVPAIMALFVRRYEISVDCFCKDLLDCPVTRPDVLRQVGSIVESLADGLLDLAYENVLLAGALMTEDNPERDTTDELLTERRCLAILAKELEESGGVPLEMAEAIGRSDRILLETIRRMA